MRRRIPRISVLLAAGVLAASFGCRDGTSSATLAGPGTAGPAFDQQGGAPPLVVCSAHGSASTSLMVGAAGASIQLGNVQLVIPGNALSDSVLITVTIPADTLADVQLEPHGLQFFKDVHLQLSTAGCSLGAETPSHVEYLDGNGTVLETLDGTFNGGHHTVVTKIHHFSSYAIAL